MPFHPSAYFLLSQVTSTSFSFLSKLCKQALYYIWRFCNKALKIPQGLEKPASFFSSTSETTVLSRRLHLWTGFAAVPVQRRASGLVLWIKCCGLSECAAGNNSDTENAGFWMQLTCMNSHSVLYGKRSLMGEGGGTGTGMCPMFLLREVLNLL